MTNASNIDSTGATMGRHENYSEKATAKAHEQVDKIGAKAAQTEERLRDKADEMKERAYRARERAAELGDDAALNARTYVRDNPLASLAIAFGAGFLISALMRR